MSSLKKNWISSKAGYNELGCFTASVLAPSEVKSAHFSYCDMRLMLSQVALQRKMLEEYEKRERNRKVGHFVRS